MMTRNRAAPLVAMIAIVAAMLIAATPVQAAAATTLKFQQYNEAPAIPLQAATVATADFGLVSEVTSPPDVAWTSSNQVFANYTAASVSTRAAPVNVALVTNSSTVDTQKNLVLGAARAAPLAAQNNNLTYSAAGNASNDFKTNLAIENTRAAPLATNDTKIAAAWMIDAKKTATSYGAIDGA